MLTLPEPAPELLRRLDVQAPRYTSYPTVPEWTTAVGSDDYVAALERAGAADPALPLSLYVHIPFCREMCLYCGCNVVISRDPRAADRYLDLLAREVALAAAHLGARRRVSRLHWGGGTPTSLGLGQIERLWTTLAASFDIEPGAEVAIEVDPVVTSPEQLTLLGRLGFNRLSMGVQDFDPVVQEAVKRRQSFALTRDLVAHARGAGFGSVNLDLIYGLPHQTLATWRRTLDQVLEIDPDRLAVFNFAYVPSARPHQKKLPVLALPRPDEKLALFRAAYESFVAGGYRPIGMDHFARPDDELAQALERRQLWRDFQGYTTRAAVDSVAFGVSGIGDVAGLFAQTTRSRTVWAAALAEGRFAIERGLRLDADDTRRRAIIVGLMCNFFVDLGERGAVELEPELDELGTFAADGLVRIDGGRIEVTPLGRLFVRNLAMVFDARLRRRSDARQPVFSRAV